MYSFERHPSKAAIKVSGRGVSHPAGLALSIKPLQQLAAQKDLQAFVGTLPKVTAQDIDGVQPGSDMSVVYPKGFFGTTVIQLNPDGVVLTEGFGTDNLYSLSVSREDFDIFLQEVVEEVGPLDELKGDQRAPAKKPKAATKAAE